jgi:DNA-binding transcriptional regulator YdaS (Cro superfamily)
MTKEQAVKWAGSIAELARILGIKPQAISQWPDGAAIPKLRELEIREIQRKKRA